jgi:hypothetical protein
MAYADSQAKPKWHGERPGTVFMTWEHPARNPVCGRTLRRARMVIGNEVTLCSLSKEVWSRGQPHGAQGGSLQEANASGKARGYADGKTVIGTVKLRVAKEETHGERDPTRCERRVDYHSLAAVRTVCLSAAKADLQSEATQ